MNEWKKHVHAAHLTLRAENSTIPDEVLYRMREILLANDPNDTSAPCNNPPITVTRDDGSVRRIWAGREEQVSPKPRPVVNGHELHVDSDFRHEPDGVISKLVIEGGLGICRNCGAGEAELDEAPCRARSVVTHGDGTETVFRLNLNHLGKR